MITQFTNNDKQIQVYGTYNEPLFKAKEIGEAIGLKKFRTTLANMDNEYKTSQSLYYVRGGFKDTTMLNEAGLYYLIMRSSKPKAKAFQKWVMFDVLPSLRKTGEYKMQDHPHRKELTFKIDNEFDLHSKVINFLKNQYPESLFTTGMGEMLDTKSKRYKGHKMGYLAGIPDIMLSNCHKDFTGFCIELKSPTGKGILSDAQTNMLKKYKRNGFKTMVSNSYDECVIEIINYMKDVRVKCDHCSRKFKSNTTLHNHLKHFHKIE
jgi:prophage antirepressor-like protein